MGKSKILKDIANNEVSLEVALSRLMIIASDLQDDALYNWASTELNGYSNNKDLPPYRVFRAGNIVYSGINGAYQVQNVPLPMSFIPKEFQKGIHTVYLSEGVGTLRFFSESKESKGRDLTSLAGAIYDVSGIQCTSIALRFDSSLFIKALDSIRTKLLSIFIELDKRLGNLDDMDVSIENVNTHDLQQTISSIIFQDNSIELGDKNRVRNSKLFGGGKNNNVNSDRE